MLEAWFAIAATGWAPTTIRQTRSVLERYLHTRLGDVPVGDVTPAMIDSTFAALRRGGGLHGRPLSTGTLARVHVVLRAAFSQAMRWGWIWDNPAERAYRLVTVSRELLPPTPAELRLLLNYVAARDLQMHAFLVLAAVTGARRAQLLGLRWQNVHLTVRRISFSAGWVEGPDGPVLSATKTKRRHVVDLDAGTVQVVANLAAERGCAARAEAFVFSDDAGATAWKPNRVTKAFLRHRRAAGLRSFRLHDLRHFMATEMLHAGVPLVIVSRRLDHHRVRQRWTGTSTLCPAATPRRRPSGRSCNQAADAPGLEVLWTAVTTLYPDTLVAPQPSQPPNAGSVVRLVVCGWPSECHSVRVLARECAQLRPATERRFRERRRLGPHQRGASFGASRRRPCRARLRRAERRQRAPGHRRASRGPLTARPPQHAGRRHPERLLRLP